MPKYSKKIIVHMGRFLSQKIGRENRYKKANKSP